MKGTIRKLYKEKMFGFITGEDRGDYFFHVSGLKNASFEDLADGQDVTFEPTEGQKGLRAEDIYI